MKSQFFLSFWRSNLISWKGLALQIAILLQFLAIEPHFVRKGCTRTSANQNRNFTSVFGDRTSFRAKGLHSDKRKSKSQFYFSFWRSNLISCERVALEQAQIKIAILLQFLAIEPHFVRKGCIRTSKRKSKSQFYLSVWRSNLISCERVATGSEKSQFYFSFWRSNFISCERVAPGPEKSQFTPVFGDRTSFRAKGLRFVPSRWHCPAPSREK